MPDPTERCKCSACRNVHTYAERLRKQRPSTGIYDIVCPQCAGKFYQPLQPAPPAPAPPRHYADRPTATLQARRETILQVPRDFTSDERSELRAIEAVLQARGVLSIGIHF
jgi:hypothetical protein